MINAAEYFRAAAARQRRPECSPVSDEELARRAQEKGGDEVCEYLLHKYRGLVRSQLKVYFMAGAEYDDLLQIGMIGLWEAIIDFRADRHTSFASFAKVCVQRQMISAIETATRQKHSPLNSSVSLESLQHGRDRCLQDRLTSGPDADPEAVVLGLEGERLLQRRLRNELSPFEWEVITEYRAGKSYKEMADALGCKAKAIDNALFHIRRKLQAAE